VAIAVEKSHQGRFGHCAMVIGIFVTPAVCPEITTKLSIFLIVVFHNGQVPICERYYNIIGYSNVVLMLTCGIVFGSHVTLFK
jgi:hypothetical protein